jgi:uncharacterized protein (DUF427 family)
MAMDNIVGHNDQHNAAPGFAKCPTYQMVITPSDDLHQIIFNEAIIAASRRTLIVREQNLRPVIYFPQADVEMALFTRSVQETHCPFKGAASYWTISANGEETENSAWCYEGPYAEADKLQNHIAFYLDKMVCYWCNGEEQPLDKPGRCGEPDCDELKAA